MAKWVHWISDLFEKHKRTARTPTVIQMESAECGAASLTIILRYYGHYAPLEEVRALCGVSRDGSNAFNVLEAAKTYGMETAGYELSAEEIDEVKLPAILFWEDSHFLVLEAVYKGECVYINDPNIGPFKLPWDKFKKKFKGFAFEVIPTEKFQTKKVETSFVRHLWQRLLFKKTIAFILISQAMFSFLGLAQPIFSRIYIDKILTQNLWDWTLPLMGCFAILFLLLYFFTYVRDKILVRLNIKLALTTSADFMIHVLKLPIMFFLQRSPGEVMGRGSLNMEIYKTLISKVGIALLNVFFIFFYAFVMFQYDALIACIGILVAVLNILILVFINESRLISYALLQMELGKLIGKALDYMINMEGIRITGAKNFVFSRLTGLQTDQMNTWQKIESKDIWLFSSTNMLQQFANISLLLLGAWKTMFGGMSIGMLVGLQFLMNRFLDPMHELVGFGSTIQAQKINLDRVNDVMKHPIDPVFLKEKIANSTSNEKIPPLLELKNITFGYAPLDDPLIRDLSITISDKNMVAIVGTTGSGKSTVARMATGLIPPWKGEILYGGRPIQAYTTEQISHSLAWVAQPFFLFEGTVYDNITLWNSEVPEELVMDALRSACILDDVLALRGGIHGHITEGGSNLSKGQQQRIEIARALLWNPSILILDEPTSALDFKLEREIFANINMKGRATMIITHRMSAIKQCQEVIVMDQGTPIERGSPDDLIAQGGVFAKYIKMQGFS